VTRLDGVGPRARCATLTRWPARERPCFLRKAEAESENGL